MEIVIRATVIYWFLWLVVRGTGKRSLAELTPLEMILIVVMGDLVQQAVNQEDMSITGAALAVSVFVAWTLASDAASRRSSRVASLLRGDPVVVLRDGRPLLQRLEAERLTVDDLKEAARIEGYGDLEELEYGILETDGKFSFVGRSDA
jgi:uncharacterized membrane protein YcaP (DUF421 family)